MKTIKLNQKVVIKPKAKKAESVMELAEQVLHYEELLQEYENVKQKLIAEMEKKELTTIEVGDNKITKVSATMPTEIEVVKFDEEKFKAEHKILYKKYLNISMKKKSGRKAYLKIKKGGE